MTSPTKIVDDLWSGQRGRVIGAVQELERRMVSLEADPLPRPPESLLDVLDDGNDDRDDDDLIASYLSLLNTYPFDPPLDPADCTRRAVGAVIAHGRSYAARQLSLLLVGGRRYAGPAAAVQQVAERGVRPGREAKTAGWLLSYLLDDAETRSETVRAIRSWVGKPVLDELVKAAAGRLTVEERALLDRAGTSGAGQASGHDVDEEPTD